MAGAQRGLVLQLQQLERFSLLVQEYKYWLDRRRCRSLVSVVLNLFALLVQKYKCWRMLAEGTHARPQWTQFTCFTGTKVQVLTHARWGHACSLSVNTRAQKDALLMLLTKSLSTSQTKPRCYNLNLSIPQRTHVPKRMHYWPPAPLRAPRRCVVN